MMYFPWLNSKFKEDELIEWNKKYCYEADDEIDNNYLELRQTIQNFLND